MAKYLDKNTKRNAAFHNSNRGIKYHKQRSLLQKKRKKCRYSPEYHTWHEEIMKRDNYTCVKCGAKKHLVVHHIRSWKYYPQFRFDIKNGVTLCKECHRLIHKQYGYDSKEEMI